MNIKDVLLCIRFLLNIILYFVIDQVMLGPVLRKVLGYELSRLLIVCKRKKTDNFFQIIDCSGSRIRA